MTLNVRRVVLVFTLVPALLMLERFAHYGVRSMLGLHLRGVGMNPSEIGNLFTAQTLAAMVVFLVGGALAFAIGPTVTLVAGFVVAGSGYALLAFASGSGGIWAAMMIVAAGQGLLRPGLFALAALELGRPNEHLRTGAFVVLYAASNLAALLAPPLSGMLAEGLGFSAVSVLAASLAGVAVLIAALLAGLWWVFRDRAPATSDAGFPGRLLAVGGGLAALGVVFSGLLALASEVQFDLARKLSPSAVGLVVGANPGGVLVFSLIVLAVCLVMHFAKARASALYFVAAGLCLGAAASLPLLLTPLSTAGSFGASLITALAEVLFMPFAMSRVSGDLPPRWTPAVFGVWFAAAHAGGFGAAALARAVPGSDTLLAALCAGVAFLLGGALVFVAAPITRWLTPSDAGA